MESNEVQENYSGAPVQDQRLDRLLGRGLLVILGISLLFQSVAIATPGWLVVSNEYSTEYFSESVGTFYYVVCDKTPSKACHSVSYWKEYFRNMKDADPFEKIRIRSEFCLNKLRQMLGPITAWVLCAITIAFLAYKVIKKRGVFHSLFHLSSMLSVAGVIMGETIYVFLVQIDEGNRMKAITEGLTIEFPYSMFFYIIACVLVFVAVTLMAVMYKLESHALMDGRLLICSVAVGFAAFALIWDYFRPFPESRPVLITCVLSYFILMGVLTVYTTYWEKGIFLVALDKDRAKIDPDNRWELSSGLKKYEDKYTLKMIYTEGKSKKNRSGEITKSVAQYFDEEGKFCFDLFEPEVRMLQNRIATSKRE